MTCSVPTAVLGHCGLESGGVARVKGKPRSTGLLPEIKVHPHSFMAEVFV